MILQENLNQETSKGIAVASITCALRQLDRHGLVVVEVAAVTSRRHNGDGMQGRRQARATVITATAATATARSTASKGDGNNGNGNNGDGKGDGKQG